MVGCYFYLLPLEKKKKTSLFEKRVTAIYIKLNAKVCIPLRQKKKNNKNKHDEIKKTFNVLGWTEDIHK